MSKLLYQKKGLILGVLNKDSIAWEIAAKCKKEGARLVLSNAPLAIRFGDTCQLARQLRSPVIPADVLKDSDMDMLVTDTMRHFKGRFDFVLHSVAMGYNIRKKHPYTTLNHEYMIRTLDACAISFHRLIQACYQQNAINEWGSILSLSFIAAHRIFPHYGEMGDAKSALESIARSFGLHYGERYKVRINTISQSPVPTTAGNGITGFNDFLQYSDAMSPLGNADKESLAALCAALFSDYTRYVTMQNIYNDGGFCATGLTSRAITQAQP
ncbi:MULTISPECIES: enoyl-ACP reductase FabI [Chitinophagaceae]